LFEFLALFVMKKSRTLFELSAAVAGAASWAPAWAHEGHGMPSLHHWHATDVLLALAAVAVVAALMVWGRRK
jgi:hypothetical protein